MAGNHRLSTHSPHFRSLSYTSDSPVDVSPTTTAHNRNPSSALLQDLLREKKASRHAQQQAVNRTASGGSDSSGLRAIQSSPLAPRNFNNAAHDRDRRSSGFAQSASTAKDMGLREAEDYVSKLSKQNFDLKLELYHRRQRNDELEAKLQKYEESEHQNEELQQLNEDLLQELEKRDVAVEEAVAIICELEARVEDLESEKYRLPDASASPVENTEIDRGRSPSQRQPGVTSHITPESQSKAASDRPSASVESTHVEPTMSPPRKSTPVLSPWRSPSFLRDTKSSTSALRNLYSNGDKPSLLSLYRPASTFSQDEDPEALEGDNLSSYPKRLSLLSESSFLSVYGKNVESSASPDQARDSERTVVEDESNLPRQMSPQESRIKQWVENRAQPPAPKKPATRSGANDAFSSIGQVLHQGKPKPLDRQLLPQSERGGSTSGQPKDHRSPSISAKQPAFVAPVYRPDFLPPTPGTMSTATLEGRASNNSIVTEKSLTDKASLPAKSYSPLLPEVRRQSSGHSMETSQPTASSTFDDDTDIETSDDEPGLAGVGQNTEAVNRDLEDFSQAVPPVGESITAGRFQGSNNPKRPGPTPYGTDMMFNGDDIWTIEPPRTYSYPSPASTLQKHPFTSSPESNGDRENDSPDFKQGMTDDLTWPILYQNVTMKGLMSAANSAGILGTAIETNLPRTSSISGTRPRLRESSSLSSSSRPTTTTNQSFATRLFRRNGVLGGGGGGTPLASSQNQSHSHSRSGSGSERPSSSRPSNFTRRTNSTQNTASEGKGPNPSSSSSLRTAGRPRPETATGAISTPPSNNIRRLSGISFLNNSDAKSEKIKASSTEIQASGGGGGEEQQQSKRLSVGALGRSASLRIKEGFARKKL
ncbi:MAG: hypothetical protein Q9190_006268 [Brigantiaea leucoxantha]